MPPVPLESSQKYKPWPAYFLVRNTGEVVPLIAVDELPPGIDLVGVPRSLDLEETTGMVNLGLQRNTGTYYQIVSGDGHIDELAHPGDKLNKLNISGPSHHTTKSAPAAPTTTPTSTPPSTPKSGSTSRLNAPNAATILCRHWCHHGICKWGQQCRYRHIMPMTLQGLQEVSLADWPAWYRKLNPGYFVNEVQTPSPGAAASRARTRPCAAGGGHGGACCGVLHGGDRRAGAQSRGLRERAPGRASKSEELGGQILARLRGMAKEGKATAAEKGNVMAERAATRETRNWEDESENSDDNANNTEQIEEVKGKLVDV